jgi:hypothetical protein
MRKRLLLAAVLMALSSSVGCEHWCTKHGYYRPAPPPAYAPVPQCCVPCPPCAPPAGYAPAVAAPNWTAPAAPVPAPQVGSCCQP